MLPRTVLIPVAKHFQHFLTISRASSPTLDPLPFFYLFRTLPECPRPLGLPYAQCAMRIQPVGWKSLRIIPVRWLIGHLPSWTRVSLVSRTRCARWLRSRKNDARISVGGAVVDAGWFRCKQQRGTHIHQRRTGAEIPAESELLGSSSPHSTRSRPSSTRLRLASASGSTQECQRTGVRALSPPTVSILHVVSGAAKQPSTQDKSRRTSATAPAAAPSSEQDEQLSLQIRGHAIISFHRHVSSEATTPNRSG